MVTGVTECTRHGDGGGAPVIVTGVTECTRHCDGGD